MAIITADYLETNYRLSLAMGAKLNAANATFAPVGFEGMYILVKQFPHPIISGGTEIEVAMPGGGRYYEQSSPDTSFTGPITFFETEAANVQQFMRDVMTRGGYFDARIFEGTPERYSRSYLIERAFIKLDLPDRDWENKAMVLMLSGTINFNYFGQSSTGNI